MQDKVTVWWVRRDLRLSDNQALAAAQRLGKQVVPLFVVDPALWHSPYAGPKRLTFLIDSLRQLDKVLQERGGRLVLRRGNPLAELRRLLRETGATTVFAEEDVSPYARRRDAAVGAELDLRLFAGLTVHPPDLVRKSDGGPYSVFTPFSRVWRGLPYPSAVDLLPAPERIEVPAHLNSVSIPLPPAPPQTIIFPAGEEEAQRRLRQFVFGDQAPVLRYHLLRDLPAEDATSGLSPYLRLGMISARQAVVAAREALMHTGDKDNRKGIETWINELIWREFYMSILYHFPQVRRGSFRKKTRSVAWENDPAKLRAWQNGLTGYPFVDAGMRQLSQSGWMHNRVRMITASFLTKDLLINWQHGERWFMQHLVDGDPSANNGGWQWVAGTGTDAAPYFRIFNPVSQSKKFDPDGIYIRRWLPELKHVPAKYFHEPWLMPPAVQQEAGCFIGQHYPAPIVDHATARKRALRAYREVAD
ncbi:MAG: cryptochrome/photolyase family protein [Candidatus Promineifilaceae bacterium]